MKKQPFRFSLKGTFFLIVCVSLIPAMAIILATGTEFGRHLEKYAKLEITRQVESFSENQLRVTEATRQLLATLALTPAFIQDDRPAMEEMLKAVHAQNKDYLNLTATDAGGIATASSLLKPGADLSERRHVAEALGTRLFSPGEYIVGLVESTPSFAFSYPIADARGQLKGTITATYKLSSYGILFEQFGLPEGAVLDLMDRNGIRLYHYPPKASNPIGMPIRGSNWEKIKAGGDRGIFFDQGSDGISRYYGYRAIRLDGRPEPYMYLVYASPPIAQELSYAMLMRNILAILFVAAFALGIAALLSQAVFGRQLKAIVDTTVRIQEGDLGARVGNRHGSSDLDQIAQALDLMAETIQARNRERDAQTGQLSRAVAEKEMLIKEVHHRVKNNLQLILSMIRLQDDAAGDMAEFKSTMEKRVASMALVHEMLYKKDTQELVELSAYLRSIVDLLLGAGEGPRNVDVCFDLEEIWVPHDRAVPFGLLMNELSMNSLKHGVGKRTGGKLTVLLRRNGSAAEAAVHDDGPGLPEGFDLAESQGLGLKLADALASQLKGELRWESCRGARFKLRFPLEA